MKSVIEDIFTGRRGNVEAVNPSAEYWLIHERFVGLCARPEETMTKEQKNAFIELQAAAGGLEGEQSLTHFKEGFKLGLLLAFEAFR